MFDDTVKPICQLEQQGWRKSWHEEHKVPYVYDNNLWIAYDDEKSLEVKVNYIKDNNLLGFMAWEMSYDDFSGEFCGQGQYPLLNSLKRAIEAPRDTFKPEKNDGEVPEFDKDDDDCKNCSSNPDKPTTRAEPCTTCFHDDDDGIRVPKPRRDDTTTTRRSPRTTAIDTAIEWWSLGLQDVSMYTYCDEKSKC
ncbi:acidic mammalian chitinase-like [Gigantopelta aegis]|uniref:acidic mammalian chitinase-like n=1 Tax=Gigantopelta aegis TaxID=1735272 RepID=UPI001B88D049|nr:acidic mammalian chitinase-like [Gigantopelta aegis]